MSRKQIRRFFCRQYEKTGFYGYVYDFSVDFDAIVVDDIDVHKYFMKKYAII